MAEDEHLLQLARHVAEGRPLDWDEELRSSAEDRDAVSQLQWIARIADVHRPRTFAHYADLLPIGAGGFGEVYRAWDKRLQREVALKFLSTPASLAEGRLLAQVRHPNIVSVHDVLTFEGRSAIVMELVRGRTLQEILGESSALPEAEAVRVAEGVGHALVAVHAAGLVHGDVSARNVLCEEGGRVVLMDFGLGHRASLATAGARGTRPYMAPELLEGGRPGAASDVFALGVLLLFARTGNVLPEEALARTGRLRPVIERAVAPRPAERFQTTEEMLGALQDVRRLRFTSAPLAWALTGSVVLGVVAAAAIRRSTTAETPSAPSVATNVPRLLDPSRDSSRGSPDPGAIPSPRGDPFVPSLGAGLVGTTEEPANESGLLLIEAEVVGTSPGAELELRTSRAASVYVLRESAETTTLVFPIPGQRPRNPLDPGLRHRIRIKDPRGILILGSPQRQAAFEDRIAALRIPRSATLEVPLAEDSWTVLRAGLGLPARGRLMGLAAPVKSHREILGGVFVRRLVAN